ncbi:MAG: hypothetical protein KGK30_09550, partial [Elusimicrobia bacterium]|nr:hypothetical protein [Elusimicrobiota bacterium]
MDIKSAVHGLCVAPRSSSTAVFEQVPAIFRPGPEGEMEEEKAVTVIGPGKPGLRGRLAAD